MSVDQFVERHVVARLAFVVNPGKGCQFDATVVCRVCPVVGNSFSCVCLFIAPFVVTCLSIVVTSSLLFAICKCLANSLSHAR